MTLRCPRGRKQEGEKRTAITPDTTRLYVKKGFRVFVERGIGVMSNFSDEEYKEAGAVVSNIPLEILSDADLILKVQPIATHQLHWQSIDVIREIQHVNISLNDRQQ